MPVEECQLNSKPGFRWGQQGKCFTYTPGNKASQDAARNKAKEQGRAVEASKDETQNSTHERAGERLKKRKRRRLSSQVLFVEAE